MFNINMFQEVLQKQVKEKKLSDNTIDGYLRCIRFMEKECGDKEGPSAGILEDAIKKICKDNKQTAKYITAIKKYEREVLGSPKILLYGEPLARIRAMQLAPTIGKNLSNSEKTYSHKINGLHDKKLKLALRLQKQSGLRVDEIARLIKNDVIFDESNQSMILRVRRAKGGKSRTVEVVDDLYLYNNLKEYVEDIKDEERLFYSTAYLKKKAGEYGMETHDLRRINSRQRFREELAGGSSRREARSAVAQQLGHDDPKVTNLYLGDEWKGGSTENEQS